MESFKKAYLKGMKKVYLLLFTLIYSLGGTAQLNADNCPNLITFRGWGNNYGYNLKLIDLSYRHGFNSPLANNLDAIFYPWSIIKQKTLPVDIGIGGGIAFGDPSSFGYGKLYLAKDFSKQTNPFYAWGIGTYADFLFGDKSQRIGFEVVNTFRISYGLKSKLLLGTSYLTSDQNWTLNLGVSVGIEKYRRPVVLHRKPVLYAYNDDSLSVEIGLEYNGELTFVYPAFKDYWDITVLPDGSIQDNTTNRNYPYLFWEGEYQPSALADLNDGFLVAHDKMIVFFEEKLAYIGMNSREITDFITFWVPILQEEHYVVKFYQQEACNQLATYNLSRTPDSFLRLYVTFEPTDEMHVLKEQTLQPIERKGFTLVEWGGMEVPSKL